MMHLMIVIVADFAVLLEASSFSSSDCYEDLHDPFVLPCKIVMHDRRWHI